MIVSCLAANGAVICSPKKSSTDCKAQWDICEMRYIRTPIIIIYYIYSTTIETYTRFLQYTFCCERSEQRHYSWRYPCVPMDEPGWAIYTVEMSIRSMRALAMISCNDSTFVQRLILYVLHLTSQLGRLGREHPVNFKQV
jgi:hypothetical protein